MKLRERKGDWIRTVEEVESWFMLECYSKQLVSHNHRIKANDNMCMSFTYVVVRVRVPFSLL